MGFLRRLLGGDAPEPDAAEAGAGTVDADAAEAGAGTVDADAAEAGAGTVDADAAERAYELELLRGEQGRLDDLVQRQIRYADHAWQPPDQGGSRRSDDADADRG